MQLFPARFLHSLLLRLAFNFAAASNDAPNQGQILNRACNLWKNGIHWFSYCGTESYVELREDSQVLVLVMRCLRGAEIDCIKLRAAVIRNILETKSVFIPNIPVNEGLLDPTQLYEYPIASIRHGVVPLYDMSMVLHPLLDVNSSTFDRSHRHCITLDRLLYWDPYMNLGRDILKELFNPAQENVELSDDFILAYSNKVLDWETLAYKVFKLEKGMVEDIKHRANSRSTLLCQRLLNSMMAFELITFGKLRQMLDGFSVFGGRDIIELSRRKW